MCVCVWEREELLFFLTQKILPNSFNSSQNSFDWQIRQKLHLQVVTTVTLWILSTTKNLNSKIKNTNKTKRPKLKNINIAAKSLFFRLTLLCTYRFPPEGALQSQRSPYTLLRKKERQTWKKKKKHTETAVFSGRKDKNIKVWFVIFFFFSDRMSWFQLPVCCSSPPQLVISFSSDIWFPSVGSGRIPDIYIYFLKKWYCVPLSACVFCYRSFCWSVCRIFHLNNVFFFSERRRLRSLTRSLACHISNFIKFERLIIFPAVVNTDSRRRSNKVSSHLNLMKVCQSQLAALFSHPSPPSPPVKHPHPLSSADGLSETFWSWFTLLFLVCFCCYKKYFFKKSGKKSLKLLLHFSWSQEKWSEQLAGWWLDALNQGQVDK